MAKRRTHARLERQKASEGTGPEQQPVTDAESDQDFLTPTGQALDGGAGVFLDPRFGHDSSRIPTHAPASGASQTNLVVSRPEDQSEQEADRVSRQASASPAPTGAFGAPPLIQHVSGEAHEQKDAAPASVDLALAGRSSPMEPALRQDMEQRLGHDFSNVRIHTDAPAAESAQEVDANAYTVGHDVVFGPGQFAPETQTGRRLLAHELTHVVQQGGSPARGEAASSTQGVLYRDHHRDATSEKPAAKAGGPSWEEALATMNAITAILPHVEESGIVLPTFGTPEETNTFPEAILKNVPERYQSLVRDWHFIVHPVHQYPDGVTVSIYGSMRETHLNQAEAETQPLVNELATEGEASSTDPYLADYWKSVERLRNDIAEEVVAEAVEKAKTEQGTGFEELSESEQAKTLVDKALEAVHLATKVVNQFNEEEIHDAIHEAEHLNKMRKLNELFAEAAQQAGEIPRGGVLEAVSKMSVVEALVHVEGGLHGVSAILDVADPAKREEMFRARHDLFGKVSEVAQGAKLALQFAAGATALAGAGTYAVAKMLGKEELATEVLAKGLPVLEKLDTAISGVMVIHGVLTLLDKEATAEEKEEAVLEIGMGGATILGNLVGAFEGGPATLAVAIAFFTLKPLAEAAIGFSVDLVKISLNQCYQYMRDEAMTVNDDALHLAMALQLFTYEQDSEQKGAFKEAVDTFRQRLFWDLSEARRHAMDEEGAEDKDPASHEPLRQRFLSLAKWPVEPDIADVSLLEEAQEYVHLVAEALAHQEEILNEEVNYVWEHYG